MKNHLLILFLLLYGFNLNAQIKNITTKYNLPAEIEETSGIIFFNGKLITHNDSGGLPNLYEIDTITGVISRTISINNATNIDWEDITQDDTYIYIGDFGNNNGTRTDLKIYKVLKTDYLNNTTVNSEIISFSYEDQTDFTSLPNNNNFDAEAIAVFSNQLILFTKNWKDNTVNAYTISKTAGTHSAKKVSSYNSNGLITGATFNKEDDSFMLCGYTKTALPFLIHIKVNSILNNDIFSGQIEKTDISSVLGQGSQIEGVSLISGKRYFLTREKVNTVFNGIPIVLEQKLYRFDNGSFSPLTLDEFDFVDFEIYPNPSYDYLFIKGIEIQKIQIINSFGKVLLEQKKSSNRIRIKELTSGIYFLRIQNTDLKMVTKKFIKP